MKKCPALNYSEVSKFKAKSLKMCSTNNLENDSCHSFLYSNLINNNYKTDQKEKIFKNLNDLYLNNYKNGELVEFSFKVLSNDVNFQSK